MNTLAKDLALLGMRIVFGGLMLFNHGISKFNKLLDYFNGEDVGFRSVFGLGEIPSLFLAVFSEVGCAILLMLGFYTKKSSWPLIVTMFVAAFIVHGPDPLKKKEMALLYLMAYVLIAIFGGGKFSLDRTLFKKR
jgi:putative oxidoreductase